MYTYYAVVFEIKILISILDLVRPLFEKVLSVHFVRVLVLENPKSKTRILQSNCRDSQMEK